MISVTLLQYKLVGIAVGFFFFGFITGYIIGKRYAKDEDEDFRRRMAQFITFVWAISVISDIGIPGYETSIWIHIIMGAIVGYLFGLDDNPVGAMFGGK